jgi:hypothetical protein
MVTAPVTLATSPHFADPRTRSISKPDVSTGRLLCVFVHDKRDFLGAQTGGTAAQFSKLSLCRLPAATILGFFLRSSSGHSRAAASGGLATQAALYEASREVSPPRISGGGVDSAAGQAVAAIGKRTERGAFQGAGHRQEDLPRRVIR